ncbi:MAG: hypothetical protein K8L97_02095 [Anaerolineae bacterium]|nr:hypothetical protein [Anaerolineae bacterium]
MTDQVQRPGQIKSLSSAKRPGDAMPMAEGNFPDWTPPIISSIQDTGLHQLAVADLVLKVLYYGGVMPGHAIADTVKLPYTGVLDGVMEFIKREKYVEVRGQSGFGESSFQYIITDRGSEKAREAMDRTQYAGPAPVPLRMYVESVKEQNRKKLMVHQEDLRKVMTNLVITDEMLSRIGKRVRLAVG